MDVKTTSAEGLEHLFARIDEARLFDLLERAVGEYSPPFAEEPAMQVFAEALQAAGVPHLRQPVPSRAHSDALGNLIVEIGPQPPALLWVGHVDTVPVIDEEQLTPRRADDVLYGLGAADMKAGCAAMVEAVAACADAGAEFKRGLAIALVVGEEEYGDGSDALVERLSGNNAAPLTVIGEPTGLVPCLDHYGYFEYRLRVTGTEVHAALPELGASAIHAMLAWLTNVYEQAQEPPHADAIAFNPREIRGGGDMFIVAPDCEAWVDIHAAPGIDEAAVAGLIERGRGLAARTHRDCEFECEQVYAAPGYRVDRPDQAAAPLKRAFEAAGLAWAPGAFRSHSDAPMFRQAGSIPVVCGPGKLEVAHTRNEHVSLAETANAAQLYTALIHAACLA